MTSVAVYRPRSNCLYSRRSCSAAGRTRDRTRWRPELTPALHDQRRPCDTRTGHRAWSRRLNRGETEARTAKVPIDYITTRTGWPEVIHARVRTLRAPRQSAIALRGKVTARPMPKLRKMQNDYITSGQGLIAIVHIRQDSLLRVKRQTQISVRDTTLTFAMRSVGNCRRCRVVAARGGRTLNCEP